MAIAAAIGNFLQGWDNATIAGTFPSSKATNSAFLKFEFTPRNDTCGFDTAGVTWYIHTLLAEFPMSVVFMQSN